MTVALCIAPFCNADSELRVPTHGNWQGQPPGSWKTTRITFYSTKKEKTETASIYKALLLGEDSNRNTIVVWGQADENGKYLSEDPTTVSDAWSEDNPVPIPDQTKTDVVKTDGQEFAVIVRTFGPKSDGHSGMMITRTEWELKSRPGFVLLHNQEHKDSFRGETYEYRINEKLTGVGHTNVCGKTVRFFRIQHDETVNGRKTSRMELLKSDELPEQGLIHSLQTWYDEDDREHSATEIELVGFGHSPQEVSGHLARMESHRFPRKYATLDSEAGKVNVAHLMRQGMPEDVAQKIVTTRISIEDLEYGQKRAVEIRGEWEAYRADPARELHGQLLQKLQQIGGNSIGYIEPDLERILTEIADAGDADLRIIALATLTGYVPVLYSHVLEDTLIAEKQYTNQPALRALSAAKWGNPRRVLSRKEIDISSLPLLLIPYAPDESAIKELMNRFKVDNKYRKSETLELLGYYSAPEVRALFSRLANELTADDFALGKTENSYLVRNVIAGTADLNIENAADLFLKWMTWIDAIGSGNDAKQEDLMMKSAIDMTLTIYGVRLRDARINARISDRITNGTVHPYLFMSEENLEMLGDINLDITPARMETLLSRPIPGLMSDKTLKEEQLYGLLRLFRFSPDDEDLKYIMGKLVPEWTPETDYAAMAEAQRKFWYTSLKDIKPVKVRGMHPEIMADVLPCFGDNGARILIQFCGYPGLQEYMVPALMKISHRRSEAREHLSRLQPRNEDNRFLIGLTLWCLGDDSQQAEFEKYIRFEPLHSSRSHKVRQALCYLPFDTVYTLLQDIRKNNPERYFSSWASSALSHHRNRKSAQFIMSLWDEETSSRRNPEYGELFNRMAGRNFGMDRTEIQKWIDTLPQN